MRVFWAGIALLAPNVLSLAAAMLALIAVEVQIRLVEEPYLTRAQGALYLEYAAATGRLLPGVGKLNH
jgi:protein-S-isoprenylcysteine O-methyltransferase Ste14